MKKFWLHLGAIGCLAILTSSCGGGDSQPSATPTPAASPAAATPAATPAPVAAAPTTPPATAPTAPFKAAPTVSGAAAKPVSPDVSAGLIPPTNGEAWARAVSKGRTDPFEMVALQLPAPIVAMARQYKSEQIGQSGVTKPLPKIAAAGGSSSSGERVLSTGSSRTGTNIAQIPRTGYNKPLPKIIVAVNPASKNTGSTSSTKLPKIAANSGATSKSPLKPTNLGASETPTLPQIIGAKPEAVAEKVLQAMAIEVSGIIEVEGKTQVIVKLPNETASRYVDVGDRLAGNIFVKRVEGQTTLSPTVIFEENGREVERKVGDKSTAANTAVK